QVDGAESEPETAYRVNALGVHYLALACRDIGAALCQISTDYVFDGQAARPYHPWDAPKPLNVYGASKWAGEWIVQTLLHRFFIVRTSSLYGAAGPNFVSTILRKAAAGEPLAVVTDQVMSPTWTVNLSRGIAALIETGMYGFYHLTDRTGGGISWFEFSRAILEAVHSDQEVKPARAADMPRPARRPAYSVLDTGYLTLATGYEPLDWREALNRFVVSYK
ncbi:MAG: dTDP-4-dehydrorhamnose reductase, partial [Burkholderiaceae bacterium]|nr:dTDP-4-dehydrorhamnose reductase [Burkholderiaceae bacterium]